MIYNMLILFKKNVEPLSHYLLKKFNENKKCDDDFPKKKII